MNCLNILSIIVPQGTLARVLVPRASMGVEITPLSENVINNFCVNNSFLYNSIPQKENMFRENMFRENMFRENMFRENMFRENMHPPRTNPRPINIEVEYSCALSHANGSSMKTEKSEKSKKFIIRVSNGRRHHWKPGALPTELYWISCALVLETRFIPCRVIISSEKRRTGTTVGFEPATLKSDPCPGEHGTSSSAW